MDRPRIMKKMLYLFGGIAALCLVGFLALGGMSLYKEWSKSPEERIAEENKEKEMQAETERLAETLDNGIQIEGLPEIGGESSIPSLDDLDFALPPGVGPGGNANSLPESTLSPEKAIAVNAQGIALFDGSPVSEEDLKEYFMIWPQGTSVLLTIDPLCAEELKLRWIDICNEAGMAPRLASEEGEEIR